MNNKKPTVRKFKGFDGETMVTIGNYGQDCATGKMLAFQFYNEMCFHIENPPTKSNTRPNAHLNNVIKRLPHNRSYLGLLVGFGVELSRYIEPLLVNAELDHELKYMNYNQLQNAVTECGGHPKQTRQRTAQIVKQWLVNLKIASTSPTYDGGERNTLNEIMIALPLVLCEKNPYAWFCFSLSKTLNRLLKAQEAQ